MVKIYGSKMCPDCTALVNNLEYYKIPYEYIDINDSLKNLKEFLVIRDEYLLDWCHQYGDIGLPACILDDGKVTIHWEEYLESLGYTPLPSENESCSISGKGC